MGRQRPLTAEERQGRKAVVRHERYSLLHHLVAVMRTPMTVLSFIWVGLAIYGLVWGAGHRIQLVTYAIWGVFVAEFLLEWFIAPDKTDYLREHWLTALSLMLPAFSTLRILRAFRLVRLAMSSGSFSLVSLLSAINRGVGATRRVLERRKVGYVATLTLIVLLAGAAGMYHFENPGALRAAGDGWALQGHGGLHNYGEAVWWTAMTMSTLGSAYSPVTFPGRVLDFLLALYALSVFGYLTAIIASYFVGQSATTPNPTPGQNSAPPAAVEAELCALREQVALLAERLGAEQPAPRLMSERRPRSTPGGQPAERTG